MNQGIELVWNEQKEISEVVTGLTWSGDIVQACRRLEIKLVNTTNGSNRALPLAEGDTLRWMQDGIERFRGILFRSSRNSQGKESWVVYDENIYLTRNQDSRRIRRETASQFIRSLCGDYGLAVGELEDTGYVIPDLKLANQSLWNMMVKALTETARQNNQQFLLSSSQGKLHLINRKHNVLQWKLESGSALLDASLSRSMEDMRNQVKVIASDNANRPASVIRRDTDLQARYGIMQHLESVDPAMSQSEMDQLARRLLEEKGKVKEETDIEAVGNPEVIAGKLIYVEEPRTGITGGYFVSSDSHTISPNGHKMKLSLSRTDDVPTVEAENV